MPKQISVDQAAKLYNILGGNIPAAAVRQDIRGWEGFERSVLTRAAEMSVQDWQKDYRKKLADDYIARAQGYDSHKGFGPESRQDISGGPNAVDELRQIKMNREACAANIFYRAMNEGDWETAKSMTEEYAPLKKIYDAKMEDIKIKKYIAELEHLYVQGYVKNIAFQCVAFIIGYIRALYGRDLWLGAVGGETAGQLLKSAPEDFKALELKNEKGKYNIIPSGSVMSNYGIWWNEKKQKYEQTTVGHTYMVLQDLGDELLIIEQAGELAAGDMPYLVEEDGDNLSKFTWKSGTVAFSGNTEQSKTITDPRYHSYYNTEEGKHVLTMMPRIRKLKKSYFEGYNGLRAPVIAAPVSSAVQKAVSMFGDKYKK